MQPFVIVQRFTPDSRLTPLRRELRRLSDRSLLAQTSNQWELVRVGEREGRVGNIHYVRHRNENLCEKDAAAIDYISHQDAPPRFVMSLDDDDLLHVDTVRRSLASDPSVDAISDSAHAYFDVTTGLFKCVRHSEFPNSAIHQWRHAQQPLADGIPLFAHIHYSTWNDYYESIGAKVEYADASSPNYLRMLSPSAVSFQGHARNDRTINAEDLEAYRSTLYLTHGLWNDGGFHGFDQAALASIHQYWMTTHPQLVDHQRHVLT